MLEVSIHDSMTGLQAITMYADKVHFGASGNISAVVSAVGLGLAYVSISGSYSGMEEKGEGDEERITITYATK